jgi:ABC-type glycerol-3-phosphate transport system permease component
MTVSDSTPLVGAAAQPRLTRVGLALRRVPLYLVVLAPALMFVVPFLMAITTSLKTPFETTAFPPTWLPEEPQWLNYPKVISVVPFVRWTANTVFLTSTNVLLELASASAVAYGFSRFRFPGRDVVFLLLLSRMMLPREVTTIPQYLLFSKLDWIDTYLPLVVPHALAGSAFAVFLLRQFFLTIPHDYDDAALVDGASSVQVFWHIILPLARPAIATIAIFSFFGNWQSLWEPLIYLNTHEKLTLAVGLTYFQGSSFAGNVPMTQYLVAYALMITAPAIVVFFCAQRYFIQGVVLTGLKG